MHSNQPSTYSMKKVLLIHYTQTGQLQRIMDSIRTGLELSSGISTTSFVIEPQSDYPYPWGGDAFFDALPETVKGIPCPLKPLPETLREKYDLILFGYQPWYLSPSIPATALLMHREVAGLFDGTPVVTVIGCRNMWTEAQRIVKGLLKKMNARLVGNIVLRDRTDNYIAGITVIRWLVHGKKGPGRLLPEAGVSERDINDAQNFGTTIAEYLNKDQLNSLQQALLEQRAVPVRYHLVNIERNARKIFDIFADYILRKGRAGESKRRGRVQLFKVYLLFVFFILSPFFSIIFMLKRWIFFPMANKEIEYLRSTRFNDK